MSIRQKRTREPDDQDKSRRLVSCPLDREPFCARKKVPRDRRGRWKEKFRRDRGPALFQPMCRPARRLPRSLSAEAGAECFPLYRSRMRQFESESVAALFYFVRLLI